MVWPLRHHSEWIGVALRPLENAFFEQSPLRVARALLGQFLVLNERVGRIVETEAYLGSHDLACHTAKGRTRRNEVMFGPPAHAYVYLIYGIHFCFNVTTGNGSAVLIRALEPLANISGRCDGPGRLTQAMGITRAHNGLLLFKPPLWLARGNSVKKTLKGPRVGVDYAGIWALKPYRFGEAESPHVSVRASVNRRKTIKTASSAT
jgi:DNA-3-methyladenine glycosylase